MEIIYLANDHILELRDLKEKIGNTYINDATITATLKDLAGNNVAGTTWPKTLSYVASSNGKYRGTLPYGVTLTAETQYRAVIVADGATYRGEWNLPLLAKLREED